jgi:predicted molibdopterin-dependent oxidoreductase YjgC
MQAAAEGKLKALYIMGENPVITDPNMHHTVKSLEALDFLVVQDIFLTDTAKLADVILPAACSFEKNGTFTNTERKVQRVRRAVSAPGLAKDDLWIISEIGKRLRYQISAVPEKVFEEYSKLWHALSGMSYARLDKYGLNWPCPTPDHSGTPYLYKDGFPRGRVPFLPVAYQPPAEVCDSEYPFILTTGRNLFQYHSGSMTRRVAPIEAHAGDPYVEINPSDSGNLGIREGDIITVQSRRGELSIKARVTHRVQEGTVFIPMHYREAAANVITNDALDPQVKIPELKVCAVRIIAAEGPGRQEKGRQL